MCKLQEPVLVTGATGFIGLRVVARLMDQGATVKALVLPDDQVPIDWGDRVEVLRGDLTDSSSIFQAVTGAGTIIHLAALVSDWGSYKAHHSVTVGGTENVLKAAVRESSRVVLISSVAVYGDSLGRDVCVEDHPFGRPLGPYSSSKQEQERTARRIQKSHDLELVIVRPCNVYGPGSKPWVDTVVEQLGKGLPTLISGGDLNAGLIFVDNVADLIVCAASNPAAVGRVYNANDDLDVTWKRYFSDLVSITGAGPPRSIPRPAADALALASEAIWRILRRKERPSITREALNLVGSDHRVPADRARRELGWRPKTGYNEGLAAVADYLRLKALKASHF